MSAAVGVAEDSTTGLYDRLRSLPIPRSAVMLGRSLADTALIALGPARHRRRSASPSASAPTAALGDVVLAFALVVVFGFACTWLFIFIGLVAGNAQAAQGMSMLVIPFSFVSSAYVPVESMPGWMQPFAANQPITRDDQRGAQPDAGGTDVVGIDHTTTYWVVLSLVWCAASSPSSARWRCPASRTGCA